MNIVVLDGYTLNPGDNPWDQIAQLGDLIIHDRTPPDQTVPRASGAEILLTNKTVLTEPILSQLPKLQYIGVLATGYNVVDLAAARQRNIIVTNIPEYGTDSVAQYTLALLLELCHRTGLHDAAVHNGEWRRHKDFSFCLRPQIELAGKTLGLIGFGRIGRRVGQLAHAFGMNLLAYSPGKGDCPLTLFEGTVPFSAAFADIPTLFAQSDVVTLHCPLTDHNRHFVNRDLLSRMKPTALLINTARGGLINEPDLAAALNSAKIAGAALDVASAEPITDDNPLLKARNCLLTPHIAWATLAARQRLMRLAAQNLSAFLCGEPINVVS